MSEAKTSTYDIEPGQEYSIDLFRPRDAEGVAKLFLSVYGRGYPVRTFIDPDKLIQENAAGRTISSVARTRKGDIVGHNALFNSAAFEGTYESGAGAVHALYRGGAGIFTSMVAHGVEIAAKRPEIVTIITEPVCNHVFSQKLVKRAGYITRAMEVDLMPAAAYTKEKSASGRVSALLAFRTFQSRPQTLYIPSAYSGEIPFLYEAMDDAREFAPSRGRLPSEEKTVLKTQVFDFARVARVAVHEAGTDFTSVMEAEEQRVLDMNVKVIQVWIKLTWPWIGEVVDELRRRGFFLGGALPRWFNDDGLLMQKIMEPTNWEDIQLLDERAEQIMGIVKKDRESVS
ncbi:MAG: hypothetical protein KQI78_14760 [Deltaproteobacteria bacterium]|nr:hypothetical protein [Deltaproteobacteria bacterium]